MTTKNFFACRIRQRDNAIAVELVVFVAAAKDILKWSGIRRVGEHEKGTQRILKPTRVRAIQRFLRADGRNTIPTGVVLAFEPGTAGFASCQADLSNCLPNADAENNLDGRVDRGILSFNYVEDAEEYLRPAFVVDGQHRLKGMALLEEDIPVLVVALIDASHDEQAFQFVVINNKSAKVPTDNVKAIISQINENDLQERLLKAGVKYGEISATLRDIDELENSPFKHLLNWPLNPDKTRRIVELTTIEACLRYIKDQFPVLEDDEDTLREVFMAMWTAAKDICGVLWVQNEKLMSKVNITALNEFITDRLSYAWEGDLLDIFDPGKVENQTRGILEQITPEFWLVEWVFKLQDNAVMRTLSRRT